MYQWKCNLHTEICKGIFKQRLVRNDRGVKSIFRTKMVAPNQMASILQQSSKKEQLIISKLYS